MSPRGTVNTVFTSLAIGAAIVCGTLSKMRSTTVWASWLKSKKAAMAVRKIRNGKRASSDDSATWLAIAQPSVPLKRS